MVPTHRRCSEIAEHPDSAAVLAAADERAIRADGPGSAAGEQVVVVLPATGLEHPASLPG